MDYIESTYALGPTLRAKNTAPFPLGWLILVIILIIIIIIILYFYFRQRSQLVEPTSCPQILGRFAVQPGVTKSILRACGNSGQELCQFTALTLSRAIDLCELHHTLCKEFSFDPSTNTMRIVDPNSARQSTQDENLYLQQIGTLTIKE